MVFFSALLLIGEYTIHRMAWRGKLLTFHLFDAFFAAANLLFHIHLNVFLATAFAQPPPSSV